MKQLFQRIFASLRAFRHNPTVNKAVVVFDRIMSFVGFIAVAIAGYKSFEYWLNSDAHAGILAGSGWAFLAGLACISFSLRLLVDFIDPSAERGGLRGESHG